MCYNGSINTKITHFVNLSFFTKSLGRGIWFLCGFRVFPKLGREIFHDFEEKIEAMLAIGATGVIY